MKVDLDAEWQMYADNLLRVDWAKVFVALGIDPFAADWREFLGLMRVVDDAGFWEPCEDGYLALTLPDMQLGHCTDIIAIRIGSGAWARRTCQVVYLGDFEPEVGDDDVLSVAMFRTPLSWLRAARDYYAPGVCVLDWTRITPLSISGMRLVAEDADHAPELVRQVDGVWRRNRVARPQVWVREQEERKQTDGSCDT